MLWQVSTDDSSHVDLTAYQVINTLTAEIISKERPDHEVLARGFAEYLQTNEALTDISVAQLVSMSFDLGYYYRIMKTQNTVKVIQDTSEYEADNSSSSDTSTD
tara:strand:+ start:106 stop:417 length:312 start_codon:yes stop_codon:yes gene_type:complete